MNDSFIHHIDPRGDRFVVVAPGKAMTWAMDPGGTCRSSRGRLESWVPKRGVPWLPGSRIGNSMFCPCCCSTQSCLSSYLPILSFQQWLPLNPDGKGAMEPSLIFIRWRRSPSNTNFQHYSGEVAMSYFSQIFGLMWLQFVSAATGIAALAALARGLAGRSISEIFT